MLQSIKYLSLCFLIFTSCKKHRNEPIPTAPSGTVLSASLRDSLVAHYSFSGNSNDESGNDNDLTIFGDPELVTGRKGNTDLAYSFDGDGDYMLTNNLINQPIVTSLPISISFWAKGNSDFVVGTNRGDKPEFTNGAISYAVTSYNGVGLVKVPELAYFGTTGAGTSTGPNSRKSYSSPLIINTIDENSWYYYTYIITGVDERKFYINGIEQAHEYDSGTNQNVAFIRGVICLMVSSDSGVKGIIDEVRIYNRVLIEAEIQELYEDQ